MYFLYLGDIVELLSLYSLFVLSCNVCTVMAGENTSDHVGNTCTCTCMMELSITVDHSLDIVGMILPRYGSYVGEYVSQALTFDPRSVIT